MVKRLTKTGNSLALVLDKPLLERLGIDGETPVEVSTDGKVIIVSPVRSAKRIAKLERVMKGVHEKYGGAFRRLAK